MKKFVIGVFAVLLILLNSCSSIITERYDHSFPMQESCMLNIENVSHPAKVAAFDDKGVFFGSPEERYIIPAGRHVIQGSKMIYFGDYSQYYDYHFSYRGKRVRNTDYSVVPFKKTFDFEPGKFYIITSTWINVYPLAADESILVDDDGNLYNYDDGGITPYIYNGGRITFRLWDFALKEVDGQFENTYTSFEYPWDINIGARYPGLLGLSFGPTYGFSFFSNPVNMRVYVEASLGIGMGIPNYDFSTFDNFRAGLPVMHIGGVVEFEFNNEFGIGLGGGYLYTITLYSPLPEETYPSPYLQLMIGRTLDGAVFVEYYPGITPIYSSFGLGYKIRI